VRDKLYESIRGVAYRLMTRAVHRRTGEIFVVFYNADDQFGDRVYYILPERVFLANHKEIPEPT